MSTPAYHLPRPDRPFARTNPQTIAQRATLLRALLPDTRAVGELCCGDCVRQRDAYAAALDGVRYCGLDLAPSVVAYNQAQGVECAFGDVLDPAAARQFLACDVVFFGPPLSVECDGHRLLAYEEVTPGYAAFVAVFVGNLGYRGTLVCICPTTTTLGDAARLHHDLRRHDPAWGLRLVHRSFATVTGGGEVTPLRLKYVELWFSTRLEDRWEVRESGV